MRLVVAAAFAAGSSALLHKKHASAPSADLDAQKAKLQEEEANFKKQKADLDNKLKSIGLYDMLHGSSSQTETAKLQATFKEMKEKTAKKAHSMSHEQALDELKDKISSDERKQLALLMEKKGQVQEDDKTLYVKAVTTLNDMFLSVEDERTNLITHCHNDLWEMYNRLFMIWQTLYTIFTMAGEAWSEAWKSFWQKVQAYNEKYKEQEKLRAMKGAQGAVMAVLDEELVKREADAALYRFIIGAIEPKCNDGGMKFVQFDAKANQQRMKCQEKCAAQGKSVMNKAVLQVFADPKVQDKAKWALNEHAQMSMKTMLGHIKQAEDEEVHDRYTGTSFLQTGKAPYEPWRIDERDGCGCGSLEEMKCETMLTLIGQELECAKQLVREQEAVIHKQKEEDKKENEDQNDVISGIEKHIENTDTLIVNAISELKNYRPPFWQNVWKLIGLWHQIHVRKWKCIMRLDDLEQNQFCALKHIRQYMSDLALEAFNAKADQLQDCEVNDELMPMGDCMMGPTPFPCFRGDYLPSNPDQLAKQTWARDVLVAPDQDPKLVEAMFNTTIALACPATMTMTLKCNVFLCPRDCEVSEWSDFSSCTADCDGGYQQRTRQITTIPRNGGAKCEETSESRECNTHPCDVDCVLHEDYVEDKGCLQACTQSPEQPRVEMLKKHVKEEAKGKGECPDKHHESRIMESGCDAKECHGDEVCMDVMDLVIAYECSIATSQLGCWFMASFVVALLQKMPSATFGFGTMQVGLVKFGNGMSLKMPNTKDQYYVKEALQLSPLTADVANLPGTLYSDVIGMWTGQTKWHLGFNNIGQAFKLGQKILDESSRTDGDIVAEKKLLVLTKGKRSGCTVVKTVAEGMKEKDVTVDLILFSQTYQENPAEFEALEEAVTFPHRYHLHNPGAASRLNDQQFRNTVAQSLIPHICPDASSPYTTLKKQCDQKVQLLHRGRTCHDWSKKLSEEPITLEQCRNKAFEKGYKSFVHTDVSGNPEAEGCNCFTHEKDGKVEPTNEEKQAVESTCNYVPDYGKDKPEEHKGWAHQEIAAGNGEITSHYKVLESSNDCPGAWGAYEKYIFPSNFGSKKDIEAYFKK